jgi:WD40 repeat protein
MSRALALFVLALAGTATAAEPAPKFRVGRPTDFTTTVMAFAPDGKTVAVTTNRGYTGGMDAPVQIWNCETGKLVHELKYHTVGVMAAAFSPDGKTLATSGIDNKLRFWDAQTGKDITNARDIALTGHGYNLNFAPDGKRLLVGSTKLEMFDVESQKPVKKDYFAETGTSQFFHSATWSPMGKWIAAAADGTAVSLWDAATGALERKIEARLTPGRTRFAFSPDDALLLVSSWPDGAFRVFDTKTGKEQLAVKPPQGEAPPEHLQFARLMGRTARVVQKQSGVTRELAVTDGTGSELKRFEVSGGVASHKLSDDGARIAVGGFDGSLRLYESESGKLERTVIGPWSEVFRTAYADAGKVLRVIHTNGTVSDFDADTGAPLKERALKLGTSTFLVCASADGKLLVTCTDSGEPTVWDVATGEEKAKPKAVLFGYREPQFGRGGPFPLPPGGARRAPQPAGGAFLPPPPPFEAQPGPPKFFAAFSADGALLAAVTGKEEDGATVFDTKTGEEKFRVKAPKGAGALAFSADASHLFVGQSRQSEGDAPIAADAVIVRRYELKTGKEVQSWKALPAEKVDGRQHTRTGASALFALADGKTLVIVEAQSFGFNPPPPGAPGFPGPRPEMVVERARIIDLAGRVKERAIPEAKDAGALAVSPDGKRVAFAALDTSNPNEPKNVLKLVDAANGKAETVALGSARFGVAGAARVTFRPTGSDIAVTASNGEVLVIAPK